MQKKKKKKWKVVQLPNFAIFFKLSCLLISNKAQQTSRFPTLKKRLKLKRLNSAITKLFYCFSRGVENGRNTKIAKISHFFWFSNPHNLLERACNHLKLYIYSESAPGNVSRNSIFSYCKIPWIFFDALTGRNEKSYIFQEIDIPEVHVQLFENFQNLIALSFDALPLQKALSDGQIGTDLGQSSPNSPWGKICKKS